MTLRLPRLHSLTFGLVVAAGSFPLVPTSRPAMAQAFTGQKLEVRGILRDAQSHAPIANADVVFPRIYSPYGMQPPSIAVKSDAAGRFVCQVDARDPYVDDEEPGKRAVYALVHAPGFAVLSAELHAGDNEVALGRGVGATGTVRDAAGKPVAGVRVKVRYISLAQGGLSRLLSSMINFESVPEGSPLMTSFETLTAADGNWALHDLPPASRFTLSIYDPRYISSTVLIPLGALGDAEAVADDMVAKPGARLAGRVLFPDGKPVAGTSVTVQVTEPDNDYVQAETALDGTWLAWGLPPGKTTVRIMPPTTEWAPTGVQNLALVVSAETRAPDITLSHGIALSGTITDATSKTPLARARVYAMGPVGDSSSSASDDKGHYTVRTAPGENRFYVFKTPTGYLNDWGNQITKTIGAADTVAPDFALRQGASITGTAFDEAGQPATGAQIAAGSLVDGPSTLVDEQGNWTLHGVDPQGARYTRRNLPKGSVALKTTGSWIIVGDVTAQAGSTVPVKLTLRHIGLEDVTIKVTTPDGMPVAGAKLNVAILFDPSNGARRMDNGVSDAHGEFVLRGLRPDESAEITPSKAGYVMAEMGAIALANALPAGAAKAPRVTNAVLAPLDGTVQGRVIDAEGKAVAGALVAAILPGDLRDGPAMLKSDAQGHFALAGLPAGEVIVGAARGREWGQTKTATGATVEIKLQSAAPQPSPHDVERTFALMTQWLDDSSPRPGYELTHLAASLVYLDRDRTQKMIAQYGDKTDEVIPIDVVIDLVRQDPTNNAAWGRAQIDLVKDPEERKYNLLQWAVATAGIDNPAAQKVYDSIAPTVVLASKDGGHHDSISDGYLYGTLAALAGRLGHADAGYWRDALAANIKGLSNDDQMFRAGSYVEAIAKGAVAGALSFIKSWPPALQVRMLEEVIPVVAETDLPTSQRLVDEMEKLVALPNMPVEAQRNDAMYRPTPAHSLDVARLAVVRKLEPTDPQAAYVMALKLTNDGYGYGEVQVAIATRLPKDEVLPALRAAYEDVSKNGYAEAGGAARIAALTAPFDAALSEQYFAAALAKLSKRGEPMFDPMFDMTREGVAAYAFYRSATDPAQSRLLLENEWQRTIAKSRAKPTTPARGADDGSSLDVSRLNRVIWAMTPLDFDRSIEMLDEMESLSAQGSRAEEVHYQLSAWLLASDEERRTMSFQWPWSDALRRQ